MTIYVLRRYNVVKKVHDKEIKDKLLSEGYELIGSEETSDPPVDNPVEELEGKVEELESKVEVNTEDIIKIKTDISALQEAIKKLNGSQK